MAKNPVEAAPVLDIPVAANHISVTFGGHHITAREPNPTALLDVREPTKAELAALQKGNLKDSKAVVDKLNITAKALLRAVVVGRQDQELLFAAYEDGDIGLGDIQRLVEAVSRYYLPADEPFLGD